MLGRIDVTYGHIIDLRNSRTRDNHFIVDGEHDACSPIGFSRGYIFYGASNGNIEHILLVGRTVH